MRVIINNIPYEIVKDYKNAFDKEEVESKLTEYFEEYDYVFGDIAYNKLRLKGFCDKENKLFNELNDIKLLDSYIEKECAYDCKYFLLKKSKNAFTLMELLGVIVILSLLMILLVPNVLEQLNNKKSEISEVQKQTIMTAAELYIDENPSYGNNYVCLKTLIEDGKVSSLKDVISNEDFKGYGVTINGKSAVDFKEINECD